MYIQSLTLAHLSPGFRITDLLDPHPTLGAIATGIAIAFGFGAVHALSPGHGKTMISAYLVGARGTPYHAVLLGIVTTLTHTLTIFLLGFGTLMASQYILPEQLYPVLSVASGLTICGVGIHLFRHRLSTEDSDHSHSHFHFHSPPPTPPHSHSHSHSHFHSPPPTHPPTHSPPPTSWPALMTLGIAGGLVPCPSALVLLLSAIALHQTTYGLLLVSGFSAGMASVLVLVGLLVLYAKQWLDQWSAFAPFSTAQFGKQLSLLSAVAIICAGFGLTLFSITS
jgi:nickel/cobalt exporter